MYRSKWQTLVAVFGVALLLGGAGALLAQQSTGNVFVFVTDTDGNTLPGVTVELSGIGAPKGETTDARGQTRFVSLDPGAYQLKASLDGFSTVEYPNVDVRIARNTSIEVELSSAISETITVTSESPLLDSRKVNLGTTVTQTELEKIPTSRDPWSILAQTPGIVTDRVNVGGNESGQQAVFIGLGVSDDENSFLVDGVEITDMAAIGSSPTYYDIDQFVQMEMSVGGSDITKTAPGASVNMVTKRGTNEFRGSGRFLVTDGGGQLDVFEQATPSISASDLGPGQDSFQGNRIQRVEDVGFEGGGAMIKDKLWIWGSWGQNRIENLIPGGGGFLDDKTQLENTSVKINTQFSGSNSAVASVNNGDKVKLGRSASPTRPQETTWDQRGPSALYKVEDTHVVNSNFFVTGTYAKGDFGFALEAKGGPGPASPEAWRDSSSVWHDNFLSGFGRRPSEEFKVDGAYFFNTGNVDHEIKGGIRLREFSATDLFAWPGRNVFSLALGGGSFPLVVFRRGGSPPSETDYKSLWVQDTLTSGNLTVNLGLRYDLQDGTNPPFLVEGGGAGSDVPVVFGPAGTPTTVDAIMPAINFAGEAAPFEWETIVPRMGITYALGEEKKTLLRASFSQFAEQLESGDVSRLHPGYYAYGYFYNLTDAAAGADPNHKFDTGDDLYWLFPAYFDPLNPLTTPSQTDPNLDPELTTEFTVGVEHALRPEFVIGAQVVWRVSEDLLETRDFIRPAGSSEQPGRLATVADYVPDGTVSGTLPDGTPFSIPTFALSSAWEFTGGNLLTNGDNESEYQGISLNFTKRLAHRWMARGYYQTGEAEWKVSSSFLDFDDPNRYGGEPTFAPGGCPGEDIDGGVVGCISSGSGAKDDVVLQTRWSWNLNGMYQVAPDRPWGFNVAANLFGREGYVNPYTFEVTGSDGQTRNLLAVNNIDDFRVDDIFTADLRVEKEFPTSGNLAMTFSIDAFNVFNENYVLQRERNLSSGSADFLRETLSPQIFRLGVRLNWR